MDWIIDIWRTSDMPTGGKIAMGLVLAMGIGTMTAMFVHYVVFGLPRLILKLTAKAGVALFGAGMAKLFAGYAGAGVMILTGIASIGYGSGMPVKPSVVDRYGQINKDYAAGMQMWNDHASEAERSNNIPWQIYIGVGWGILLLGGGGLVRAIIVDVDRAATAANQLRLCH